jgi:hypothetical protein
MLRNHRRFMQPDVALDEANRPKLANSQYCWSPTGVLESAVKTSSSY